jgi:SAM-dependent methyltransferase
MIADPIRRVLVCPQCGGPLSGEGPAFACAQCATEFAPTGKTPDLRLRRPKRAVLEVTLDGAIPRTEGVTIAPLQGEPPAELARAAQGAHMDAGMVARFPRANGGLALDLGCGTGLHRSAVETAGFTWVGLDYHEPGALLFGDAHALPFRDGVFDFVLSVATLEHLRNPLLGAKEAFRVARPGAALLGTVAFMETFHDRSYFHHSHLGTLALLQDAGWEVTHVAPSPAWNSLTAQACMGLFPRMPPALSRGIVKPVEWLHRLWWRAGRLKAPSMTELARQLTISGAFTFVARKPAAEG